MKVKNKRPYNRSETCTRSGNNSASGSTSNSTSSLPEKITAQLDNANNNYTITNTSTASSYCSINSRKKLSDPSPKGIKTRHKSNKHTNSSSMNNATTTNNGNIGVGTSLKITHRGGRSHLSSINTDANISSSTGGNNSNNTVSNTIRLTNSKSSCCSSNNCSSSSTSSVLSGGNNETVDPYEFAVKTDETTSQGGLNESLLPIKRLKLERNDDRCLIPDSARSSPMLHTTSNRIEMSFSHPSPGANSSPLVQLCTRPLSVCTDFSCSNNTINNNNSSNESSISRSKADIIENFSINNNKRNSSNNSNTNRTPVTVTTVPSLSPHAPYPSTEMSPHSIITGSTEFLIHIEEKSPDGRAETPPTVPACDPSSNVTPVASTATISTTDVEEIAKDNISGVYNVNVTDSGAQSSIQKRSFSFGSTLNNFERSYLSESKQSWINSTSPLLSTATTTLVPTTVSSLSLSSRRMSSCLLSSSSIPETIGVTPSSVVVTSTTVSPPQPSAITSTNSSLTSISTSFGTCPTIKPERRCAGVNTVLDNCKATLTEPDLLGPCEPGTTICLNGIVWLETTTGVLVVNVTWRGRTYIGTLLDATQHDFAPPCPRDYIPPFKTSIRSSSRTKRRAAVGSNYKPNLGNYMVDCSWKSGSSIRHHRLHGRAHNSPAVMPEINPTTRSSANQQPTHIDKTDISKAIRGDTVSDGDGVLIQCLPQVSDEELLRDFNQNTKIHKSRKIFRGSSTSSSDCPSELLPYLEKSSEIEDAACKSNNTSDRVPGNSQKRDNSRPHTPLCSNDSNSLCPEEDSINDELNHTFPIDCPIDGCKKRFSHVLALRFHLNHTPHDNLLNVSKKYVSSANSKQDYNDDVHKNCGSHCHMKSPPNISPQCPSSPCSPVSYSMHSSHKQSLQPLLRQPPLQASSQTNPQSWQQNHYEHDNNLHHLRHHQQQNPEYEPATRSLHLPNISNHNYKVSDDANGQKFMDTNIPDNFITGVSTNLNCSTSGRNNDINKHLSGKKRLSTSVVCSNQLNEITSTGNNVRTVTAHTVFVPHGSLDCGTNSNLRSNSNSNNSINNQPSLSSKRTSSNPRDPSRHKSSQPLSNQNIKTDKPVVMMMSNYPRCSGLPGSRMKESNNTKEINDHTNSPLFHVALNTATSLSSRLKSPAGFPEVNCATSSEIDQPHRGFVGDGVGLVPNFQNPWNFQVLPIKDKDQQSSVNSLSDAGSSQIPVNPSGVTNSSSTNEAMNHHAFLSPQLFDSKHLIPPSHLSGTSLNNYRSQITDPTSMYYGIPDFLATALSTLTSNASSSPYPCIPEAFRPYMNQNTSVNTPLTGFSLTTGNNNSINNIPKAHDSSAASVSSSSTCGSLLDRINSQRFLNPQLFENLGSNLSNLSLNPERLDPLKLSAAYLMQYTNPGSQLFSSSSPSTSGSQLP
ncbi:unnamed protein product [Trichobilharzia szidati]|nr:unnamed protein product [Trichobilharzia szidati]